MSSRQGDGNRLLLGGCRTLLGRSGATCATGAHMAGVRSGGWQPSTQRGRQVQVQVLEMKGGGWGLCQGSHCLLLGSAHPPGVLLLRAVVNLEVRDNTKEATSAAPQALRLCQMVRGRAGPQQRSWWGTEWGTSAAGWAPAGAGTGSEGCVCVGRMEERQRPRHPHQAAGCPQPVHAAGDIRGLGEAVIGGPPTSHPPTL